MLYTKQIDFLFTFYYYKEDGRIRLFYLNDSIWIHSRSANSHIKIIF